MRTQQAQFVSISLARLRRGVSICCWILAASLITHMMVWCVATFMDVRYINLEMPAEPTLVVNGTDHAAAAGSSAIRRVETVVASKSAQPKAGPNPNRVLSRYDRTLLLAANLSGAAGLLAVFVLVPLVGLGVLVGTASCTTGVERTSSAFIWSVILAVLVLPTGNWMLLPWDEGALPSYSMMCRHIDVLLEGDKWGSATFYARFAAMPLACLVATAIIGFRFSAGVESGIPVEDTRLDPELEREAANIKATSLHGGRAGAAMRSVVGGGPAEPAGAGAAPRSAGSTGMVSKPTPAITQVTAGEAPRRLI